MEALILSCGTGGGHNAAGEAVAQELEKRGWQVEFFNPYHLKSSKLENVIDMGYIKIAQFAPRMFGLIYWIGNIYRKLPFFSPVYHANRGMKKVLKNYMKDHSVDAIIMPHLFPAEIITQMRRSGEELPLTVFVGTDYTCIPFTEETECDYYIIPSEELRKEYVKRGIPEEKIKAFGIPTREEFPCELPKEEAKRVVGLQEQYRYILISGGSIGAGKMEKCVRILHKYYRGTDVRMVVICGNNQHLYEKLSKKYQDTVVIIQKTNKIAQYLRACDLYIGKPGGLSSTEAAVTETSFVQITPIPGCESRNIRYFAKRGMSVGVKKIRRNFGRVCDEAMEVTMENTMKENQRKNINSKATQDICDLVIRECEK